jgi:hypothetical protein
MMRREIWVKLILQRTVQPVASNAIILFNIKALANMHDSQTTLPDDFHKGLQAFNQQQFFQAHEHFEDAWRATPGEAREFYRAFLHVCGGFYRLTQDRPAAAQKFFTHAEKWLAGFPGYFSGFNVFQIRQHLERLILAIQQDIPSSEILKNQFHPIHPDGD